MLIRSLLLLSFLSACAASSAEGDGLGSLELGLGTQAAGVPYRLSAARFTLDGPEPREFSAPDDVERLALELPQGAYRLTLHEGYALARGDAPESAPVAAKLVSANPLPITIAPGETTRVALRFELAGGGNGAGKLEVGVEVAMAGATCDARLAINELDYEQPGSDDAEFIELLNPSRCELPLDGLTLELVNGGDGKVYSRYALVNAAPLLAPGERLVIGDPNVLAALPAGSKQLMLNGAGLQNGPDAVRVLRGEELLDAVSYAGTVAGVEAGEPAPVDDGELSLGRCPDGFDTGDGQDFQLGAPTPGAANACS